jgi:hypothetical protein
MATVRISQYLRTYVRNEIRNRFKQRIEAKQAEFQNIDPLLANKIFEHRIPSEERSLLDKLSKSQHQWISENGSVSIHCEYVFKGTTKQVQFLAKFRPPTPSPVRWGNNIFVLREGDPFWNEVSKIAIELEHLSEERDTMISELVEEVMFKCTTIAQALEFWPSILEFLPEQVRIDHRRVVEKKTREKPQIELSESAKLALIKTRLSGS